MKKLIIVLFMLCIVSPVFGKTRESRYSLSIGASQTEVKNIFGNPSIITKDSDDATTWIYEEVSSIPAMGCSNFANVNADAKDTMVIIKFDANENVSNFSYHKGVF